MKIGYFSSYFSSPGPGPSRLSQYLQEYSGKALQITFFTDDKVLGLPNVVEIKRSPILSSMPGYWIFRSLKFYLSAKKRKNTLQFLIFSNAFEALFYSLSGVKIPFAVMVNDDNYLFARTQPLEAFNYQTINKFISRYLWFDLEKRVIERADMVITCSRYLKEQVIKKYKKDSSKVKILFPAVDLEFFTYIPRKRKEEFLLLFLKQDWRRGGIEDLAQALGLSKEGSKMTLCLAGMAEKNNSKIVKIFNQSGFKGKIKWLGVLSKEQVKQAFHQSDLFVLPSKQEAFGTSILEALATGTPVIAAETGGIPEATDYGKAAFLVKRENPMELAELIDRLFNDPFYLKSKEVYACRHVQQFSKNHLYSCLEEICLIFKPNK